MSALDPTDEGLALRSTHALSRTSPKGPGQKFIGTCFKCGTENLPIEAVSWPCENPANLTQDEALIHAVKAVPEGNAP